MRTGYMPLALALRDAVSGQNTYNSQLNHVTEAKNPTDKEVWFTSTLSVGRPKVFARIRVALQRAFEHDHEELGSQLAAEVSQIEIFLERDRGILAQLFAALKGAQSAEAVELRSQLVTRGTQALIRLRNLEERVNLHLDEQIDAALDRERASLRVLLLWAGFTVLFGAAVALYARGLLRPLLTVTKRAQAVAKGDFTPRPVSASNDEIGELAVTFESMVDAIARANRELLEAERLATIGKMAAQVTHEVRNPLSSIGLNVELLEEELSGADQETRRLCSAIKREVDRLTELTEQYLSIARRNDPRLDQEDLAAVAADALVLMRPELEKNGICVETEFEPNLPKVLVDEAQLRQVIHNLLRNARQAASPGGTVRVVVGTDQAQVFLAVEDNGPGVDEEVRSRLFEPFFTTRKGGTGLGLAVSRHIVDTHHGRIECQAIDPKGTRFVVRLPRVPGAQVPESSRPRAIDAAVTSSQSRKRRRS